MDALANAARTAANANVRTWLVPGAKHAQSFKNLKQAYVARVVAFYNATLGLDTQAI